MTQVRSYRAGFKPRLSACNLDAPPSQCSLPAAWTKSPFWNIALPFTPWVYQMAANSPGLLNKANIHHLSSVLLGSGFWLILVPFSLELQTSQWDAYGSLSPCCPTRAPKGQLHCYSSLEFPSPSPDPNPCKCKAYLVYKALITGHLHQEAPLHSSQVGSVLPPPEGLTHTFPSWLRATSTFLLVLEQPSGSAGVR